MVVSVFYAATRYTLALGIPLGMSRSICGQQSGTWISGLFLANVSLMGAILMIGLVQHWGEVFPCLMIGMAGRRVPIALTVVQASILAVPLMVTGTTIWSGHSQMTDATAAIGEELWIMAGFTLLLPVRGAARSLRSVRARYTWRS